MKSSDKRKVNVLEMRCLRSLVRVSRMDRVLNEEVSQIYFYSVTNIFLLQESWNSKGVSE